LKKASISKADWDLIKIYVDVLGPFKEATVIMSSEKYLTASMYLQIVIGLKENPKSISQDLDEPKETSKIVFSSLENLKVSICITFSIERTIQRSNKICKKDNNFSKL